MIGLDTNVLVRYAIRDDPEQTFLADQLIDGFTTDSPGFLSLITLVETWWVLTRAYLKPINQVTDFIKTLLSTSTLTVQDADLVHQALRAVEYKHADFADALITAISKNQGCSEVKTFDQKAVKRAGMTSL